MLLTKELGNQIKELPISELALFFLEQLAYHDIELPRAPASFSSKHRR